MLSFSRIGNAVQRPSDLARLALRIERLRIVQRIWVRLEHAAKRRALLVDRRDAIEIRLRNSTAELRPFCIRSCRPAIVASSSSKGAISPAASGNTSDVLALRELTNSAAPLMAPPRRKSLRPIGSAMGEEYLMRGRRASRTFLGRSLPGRPSALPGRARLRLPFWVVREAGSGQSVNTWREHGGMAFSDERAVPASRFWTRQAGDARQLARHGHARIVQEASRDFANRGLTSDATAKRLGEPADGQRPDVGEFRNDRRPRSEPRASPPAVRRALFVNVVPVGHSRLVAQVRRGHFPFVAQHAQDRPRGCGSAAASPPLAAAPTRRESKESCAAQGTSSCRARAWHSRPCRA